MRGGDERAIRTAGFWRRAVAFSIDTTIALTAAVVVGFATGQLSPERFPEQRLNLLDHIVDIWNQDAGLILGPVLLFAILHVVLDAALIATLGTTVGKRTMGLSIFDPRGERPGLLRAIARALLRPLSFSLMGFGVLWVAVQRDRRAWHDLLAGTWVGSPADPAEIDR